MQDDERSAIALEEIARWTRFIGLRAAKEMSSSFLRDDTDRAIYFLSRGASSRDIARTLTGLSHNKVAERWGAWQAVGLMRDSVKFRGRKEAAFTLEELGQEVPAIVKKFKASEPKEAEDESQTMEKPVSKTVEDFGGGLEPTLDRSTDSI